MPMNATALSATRSDTDGELRGQRLLEALLDPAWIRTQCCSDVPPHVMAIKPLASHVLVLCHRRCLDSRPAAAVKMG